MAINPVLRNFLITIAALAVLGGGVYLYTRPAGNAPASPAASTTTQILPDGTAVTGLPEGATVTEVPSDAVQAPDYTKPIVISPSLSADVQAAIKIQFEDVKKILGRDPANFDAWIRLGTLHKIAGDYAGAAEDWEYTAKIYPGDEVSHNNLGDLYMNFLKDYPKAELNYKAVIKLKPQYVPAYQALFYLYRDIYKDSAKAEAIRAQGIKSNPGDTSLQKL